MTSSPIQVKQLIVLKLIIYFDPASESVRRARQCQNKRGVGGPMLPTLIQVNWAPFSEISKVFTTKSKGQNSDLVIHDNWYHSIIKYFL
jgi:hypothetical protein